MKRTGNKNLKIAAATMMTIFSLFTCFSGAMAWFMGMRTFDEEIDNFEVKELSTTIQSISVHDFFGFTEDGSEYGFDPSVDHTISWSGNSGSDAVGFQMGKYSLSDPHHPVLFLFEITDGNQAVILNTKYPYLANDEPLESVTVASYSTLGTYDNGTIIKVENDEKHNNLTTKYAYVIPETGDPYFEMKWVKLSSENNPLSSIVMTHWFLFEDDPRDSLGTCKTKTGDLMVDDGEGNKTKTTKTYVTLNSSSFTSSNESSFVSFDINQRPVFNSSAVLYDGSTSGYKYLGIVLDYNSESLEYIYSYFLGHTLLNDGLHFKCDWEMEI